MIYIGIDDTDNLTSRGTGLLSRNMAAELSKHFKVYGVTRHQHFVHESIPYTSHNSSAVIHLAESGEAAARRAFELSRELMLADFVEGSDPGLAVATAEQITPSVVVFGFDTKSTVVTQKTARSLAKNSGIMLEGLGGTELGVIGAIGGIGLASTGFDGSFLMKDATRKIRGQCSVSELKNAGIDLVMTLDGRELKEGVFEFERSPNPVLVCGKAVLFMDEKDGKLAAVKRR